jgi:hypothetical protein
MKAAAILCFIISALAGLRAIIVIIGGAILMSQPNSNIEFDVFLPRSVGMLLPSMALLILGLYLFKKSKKTPLPLPK